MASPHRKFLDRLSAETQAALVDAGIRRRYPANTFLFLEGDPPASVFIVEEGMLRVDRAASGGRTVLLTLATRGDSCGELGVVDPDARSATAQTVTPCRLLAIPADRYLQLMREHPDLPATIIRSLTARLRVLSDQFVEVAVHSATARVAGRLLELMGDRAVSGEEPIEVPLPITQAELAQWCGLAREGAVGALRQLREDGIISTERMKVVVHDVAELRRVAEG